MCENRLQLEPAALRGSNAVSIVPLAPHRWLGSRCPCPSWLAPTCILDGRNAWSKGYSAAGTTPKAEHHLNCQWVLHLTLYRKEKHCNEKFKLSNHSTFNEE